MLKLLDPRRPSILAVAASLFVCIPIISAIASQQTELSPESKTLIERPLEEIVQLSSDGHNGHDQKAIQRIADPESFASKNAIESPLETVLLEQTRRSRSRQVQTLFQEWQQPAPANPGQDNPKVRPGIVNWHKDLATAKAMALRSGKPVFHFHLMGNLDERFT